MTLYLSSRYPNNNHSHIAVSGGSSIEECLWRQPLNECVSVLKGHVEGSHVVDLDVHTGPHQDVAGTQRTVGQLMVAGESTSSTVQTPTQLALAPSPLYKALTQLALPPLPLYKALTQLALPPSPLYKALTQLALAPSPLYKALTQLALAPSPLYRHSHS